MSESQPLPRPGSIYIENPIVSNLTSYGRFLLITFQKFGYNITYAVERSANLCFQCIDYVVTPSPVSNSRIFPSHQKETLYLLVVSPNSPLPALLATTNQIFVSMDLPLPDISHTWNRAVCGFLDGLISLNIVFSIFIHIVMCSITDSLLKLNDIPLCAYTVFVYPFVS